ncbi:hypothetical protein L2E82_44085 [Cichorium intybus]|uniref:Uncharacterized protein n=1 Tax=Cichorium intybus TaxID=13427 RepID=A0ACB8ZQA0_CICIN|nr:hypothetical protein L2E82_44085 [Cichorium intybus]
MALHLETGSRFEGKPYLIECPLPILPRHGITQQLHDEHDFLIDESEEVCSLMLLTIDPKIRKDFVFIGPYDWSRLLEERSSVGPYVLKIVRYIGELCRLGHPIDRKLSADIILNSLTSQYDLFIQMYRKGNQDKTIMKMYSMLTLYELFIEIHGSIDPATSGLSPVMRHIKRRSRSTVGPVLRCLKLGIHRVGYSHRKIGRCSKAKQFGNSEKTVVRSSEMFKHFKVKYKINKAEI